MYDTGLAARIAVKGVPVSEIAGWQHRGRDYADYGPRGGVFHHTAGSSRGSAPSLTTIIYGRAGLPGPLAQVLQSREANPADDRAIVVAAGTANHAGSGGWRGLSGNHKVAGLEVEHTGTSRVDPRRLETSARIMAALIEAPGSPRDARLVCQHFEWTSRKIDFHDLTPWTPESFRARVAAWVGRTAAEDDMPLTDKDLRRVRDAARRGVGDAFADEDTRVWRGARDAATAGVERSDSVRSLLGRSHTMLVVADDRRRDEPIWITDWIVKAPIVHGGPRWKFLRAAAKFAGKDPDAQPIPRDVLDDIPTVSTEG